MDSSKLLQGVKILRDATGAKFTECHKALSDSDGDIEAAKDLIRIRGLSSATNKTSRETGNGVVGVFISEQRALVVEILCETDFVAMNEKVLGLTSSIGNMLLHMSATDLDDRNKIMDAVVDGTNTVKNAIDLAIDSTGENIKLGRIGAFNRAGHILGHYVHRAYAKNIGKIGVLVSLKAAECPEAHKLADDIAMQIAAMKPIALDREHLPSDVVAHEMNVHKNKAEASGKPTNVIEKMISGSMEKFYSANTLLDQIFIIGEAGKSTVRDKLAELAKVTGNDAKIESYLCYIVG